jgi:glycosyltransferase involved in cell wall biosynthesis
LGKPFVSVLIDTYHHERFIEQAIVSVLEQDFPASDRETLVVDDGSTDRTPEIVRRFEPHVRLLRKENGGQASAFNVGIPECRGEILAFLDGDDWWERKKLSIVVEEFQSHPQIGTFGHGFIEVNEGGEPLAVVAPRNDCESRLRDLEEGSDFLTLRAFLGTSRLAIRKGILRQVGSLPAGLEIEADEFLATVATALGGVLVLKEPLTNYRYHSANLFQFEKWDAAKAKRKHDSLACIVSELPSRLQRAGVLEEVIRALTDCVRVDTERLRLSLGNGWPWETVRLEREANRQTYGGASFGYHLFHAAVLATAAVLPPAVFYRLRRWYTKRDLARTRQMIGSAQPVPSLAVRTARAHERE